MECTGTLAALPMAPDLLQRFLTTSPLYSLRIFSADASEHSASAIYDVNVKYSVFPHTILHKYLTIWSLAGLLGVCRTFQTGDLPGG